MGAYSSLLKAWRNIIIMSRPFVASFINKSAPLVHSCRSFLLGAAWSNWNPWAALGPFLIRGALLDQCPEYIKRPLFDTWETDNVCNWPITGRSNHIWKPSYHTRSYFGHIICFPSFENHSGVKSCNAYYFLTMRFIQLEKISSWPVTSSYGESYNIWMGCSKQDCYRSLCRCLFC